MWTYVALAGSKMPSHHYSENAGERFQNDADISARAERGRVYNARAALNHTRQRDQEATMDELVKQVAERTGIGEEQARQAVDTVLGFLKARLPESVAGYVDSAIGSQQANDSLGGVAGQLGNIFGGE
jgi:hypothetical protein